MKKIILVLLFNTLITFQAYSMENEIVSRKYEYLKSVNTVKAIHNSILIDYNHLNNINAKWAYLLQSLRKLSSVITDKSSGIIDFLPQHNSLSIAFYLIGEDTVPEFVLASGEKASLLDYLTSDESFLSIYANPDELQKDMSINFKKLMDISRAHAKDYFENKMAEDQV